VRLLWIGATVTVVGLVSTLVLVGTGWLGDGGPEALGGWSYLLVMLAPVGFVLLVLGTLRRARQRRREAVTAVVQARATGDSPPATSSAAP
jgi:H+/Cl- antiporter ClcA